MLPYDQEGRLQLCRERAAELAEDYRRTRRAARESGLTERSRVIAQLRALLGRKAARLPVPHAQEG
jgi:hypothetical protein